MKKKMELPDIPMLKKPVIAINIDFKKKKEYLVIGDFDNVNSFLRGQKILKYFLRKSAHSAHFCLTLSPSRSILLM